MLAWTRKNRRSRRWALPANLRPPRVRSPSPRTSTAGPEPADRPGDPFEDVRLGRVDGVQAGGGVGGEDDRDVQRPRADDHGPAAARPPGDRRPRRPGRARRPRRRGAGPRRRGRRPGRSAPRPGAPARRRAPRPRRAGPRRARGSLRSRGRCGRGSGGRRGRGRRGRGHVGGGLRAAGRGTARSRDGAGPPGRARPSGALGYSSSTRKTLWQAVQLAATGVYAFFAWSWVGRRPWRRRP